MSRMK